ncbi:hypothetical protein H6F95_19385 [Cyanobacteria bacterium FACHB-471]|nr:hypothetical protein [Cyanobacteria bacterium FACHB-471]
MPAFLGTLIAISCSIVRPAWILIPLVIQLIASWVLLRSPEIKAFLSS